MIYEREEHTLSFYAAEDAWEPADETEPFFARGRQGIHHFTSSDGIRLPALREEEGPLRLRIDIVFSELKLFGGELHDPFFPHIQHSLGNILAKGPYIFLRVVLLHSGIVIILLHAKPFLSCLVEELLPYAFCGGDFRQFRARGCQPAESCHLYTGGEDNFVYRRAMVSSASRAAWVIGLAAVAGVLLTILWPPREMVERIGVTVRDDPGQDEVAMRLRKLQEKLHAFLKRAPQQDPRIKRIRGAWAGTIAEIDRGSERDGSLAYSLNKDTIHICIRAPDGSLSDENNTIFVLLHELAHIASVSLHHTPEFWENFKFLLELAEILGFYTYVDHAEGTATMCGHVLGPSPLTCVREQTCASTLG